MSYILEALKKADRDRNLGEVPDLETSHWRVRKHARAWKWVWAVGALLIFNALLLFLLLERNGPEEIAATALPQREKTLPEGRATRPVQVDPAMTQTPEMTRPRVQRPAPAVLPRAVQGQQARVRPAPQASLPAPQASQQAPVSSGEFDIPEWRELSLEFRSGFTLPRIDVHVYSEDPGRRFIMADLKKYREGETLANGSVLEKIHPGSIQLNYQGKRFRVER
jgi:general secretion pathway protein B